MNKSADIPLQDNDATADAVVAFARQIHPEISLDSSGGPALNGEQPLRQKVVEQLAQEHLGRAHLVHGLAAVAEVGEEAGDQGALLVEELGRGAQQRWVIAILKKTITNYITNYFYTK